MLVRPGQWMVGLGVLVLLAGACTAPPDTGSQESTGAARGALTAGAGSVGDCNGNAARCTAVHVTAGVRHTVTLKSDGTVWTFGYNAAGQLGDGTTTDRMTPVQVSGLAGVTAVAAGWYHTVALKSDGTVRTWGTSGGGLGDGTMTTRTTPVQPLGLAGVTAVTAGVDHTVVLKSDGTLWAFGYNNFGQLGDGTTVTRLTPVQVGGLTGVTAAAGGFYHTVALKADGTVWAWGANAVGQLGDGTTTARITPVQVTGLTGVTAVASGSYHTLALKADGTVWAWGSNHHGQTGSTPSSTPQTVPVQVAGLGGVTAVAAGFYHTVAVKSDGTVWALGNNGFGQLGDGTTTDRSAPVEVHGLAGTLAVAAGGYHTVALAPDGAVRAWGRNDEGYLGDGTTTQHNTPVQASGLHLFDPCVSFPSCGALGACSSPAAPDGSACDDGDPGTVGDVCGGGACSGLTIATCAGAAAPGPLVAAQLFVDNAADIPNVLDSPDTNQWGTPYSVDWAQFTGVTQGASLFTASLLRSDLTLTKTILKGWWGSSTPNSVGYYTAITGGNHFTRVLDIGDVRRGDLLAIRYLDPQSTGHAAMIDGCPVALDAPPSPVVAGLTQYAIQVIDSTSAAHGCAVGTPTADARWVPNNPAQPCSGGVTDGGAGRGTMRLYAVSPGLPGAGTISGYAWSLTPGTTYYDLNSTRPHAIGRYFRDDLCAGVTCTAPDQCHGAGTCDPATGVCSNPAKPDGSACDDGDACTLGDACQAGACGGAAVPPTTFYADADGDGHGDPSTSFQACAQPAESVVVGDDCDDTNASAHPGATEACNGVDDNCNGNVDENACPNNGIIFATDISVTPRVIAKLDSAGNRLENYGAAQAMVFPTDLAIGPDGMLWVYVGSCSAAPARVLRYDPSNGAFLGTWATLPEATGCDGSFAFGSDGNLYLRSYQTAIKRFNGQTGAAMADLGTTPTLSNVYGLATGPDGYLYVTGVTAANVGTILRFQVDGTYLGVFATGGNGNGPRKPIWDVSGNLYSANLNDGTVRVLDGTTGALLEILDPPSNGHQPVAFLPNGHLIVGGVWNNTISLLNVSDGANLGSFATGIQSLAMVAW